MKKLLALILSIGMCFGFVGCGEDNSNESQSSPNPTPTTENNTTQEPIDDVCDLSNEQTQELEKKLQEASVYPITYGYNNIIAGYQRYQSY